MKPWAPGPGRVTKYTASNHKIRDTFEPPLILTKTKSNTWAPWPGPVRQSIPAHHTVLYWFLLTDFYFDIIQMLVS